MSSHLKKLFFAVLTILFAYISILWIFERYIYTTPPCVSCFGSARKNSYVNFVYQDKPKKGHSFFAFKAILIRHKTSKLNLPILPIILFFFAKYRGHNPFINFVQIAQSFPFFFRKIHHQCISSFFCS